MTFEKSNFGYFLAFMLVGALLGAALGSLLVSVVPGLSVITRNLTGPLGIQLEIITFQVRLNLSAIAGLVAGIILFRKV